VRNLAALDRALSLHPALDRAVCGADGAPPLGRAAALVIARIAVADSVERWIEAGRRLTVRALKVAAARARQGLDPFEDDRGAVGEAARAGAAARASEAGCDHDGDPGAPSTPTRAGALPASATWRGVAAASTRR
jgi:hypothetical protein